jgi:hypothetical protein
MRLLFNVRQYGMHSWMFGMVIVSMNTPWIAPELIMVNHRDALGSAWAGMAFVLMNWIRAWWLCY